MREYFLCLPNVRKCMDFFIYDDDDVIHIHPTLVIRGIFRICPTFNPFMPTGAFNICCPRDCE